MRPVCLLGLMLVTVAGAAEPPLDYNRDIRPILSEKCVACHGPDDKKRYAGLRLDERDSAVAVRSGKASIVAGNPDASELIRRVIMPGKAGRMPMGSDPLTPAQIAKLRQWITEGARFDEHWSYVAPKRPPVPAATKASWGRNAVDNFILARLEAAKLAPSQIESPSVLLRRVYLDLTGLPPSVADVETFERDPSWAAWQKTVDRLLASPRFGERWARHWLDLARYADSAGYQHDDLRTLWPYRDWVIRAFNSDMPFDRFTVEQLAGDLVPNAGVDQRVATGFHRASPTNLGGDITLEQSRHEERVDRVNTTAVVWMATTAGCAQCHTHKYDPVTITDYYRLYAFFNQADDDIELAGDGSLRKRYRGATVELPVDAARYAKYEDRKARHDVIGKELESAESAALAVPAWQEILRGKPKLPPDIPAILAKPASARTEVDNEKLQKAYLASHPQVAALRTKEIAAKRELEEVAPPVSLALSERKKPVDSFVLLRGNMATPGEAVTAIPPGLPGMTREGFEANRLGLAKWIVDRRNPLTARVVVNRLWAEIFGIALVASTEDFGHQGDAPSHPELLDWLAVEFMDNGWSVKHMIRLMVTSETYRQSAAATPELLAADPQNRLLGHGPRFRLDAESIRDVLLSTAGLLSLQDGGPPAYPPQPAGLWKEIAGADVSEYAPSGGAQRYRRGIYTVWRRGNPYPSFLAFDAPTRSECTARRARTNTPGQALTLLNDPVYVEAADALAKRLQREKPDAPVRERIAHAFRLCVARAATAAETDLLTELFERESKRAGNTDRAWHALARVLLNLDETITKG